MCDGILNDSEADISIRYAVVDERTSVVGDSFKGQEGRIQALVNGRLEAENAGRLAREDAFVAKYAFEAFEVLVSE